MPVLTVFMGGNHEASACISRCATASVPEGSGVWLGICCVFVLRLAVTAVWGVGDNAFAVALCC